MTEPQLKALYHTVRQEHFFSGPESYFTLADIEEHINQQAQQIIALSTVLEANMNNQEPVDYIPTPVCMSKKTRAALHRAATRSSSTRVALNHIAWLEKQLARINAQITAQPIPSIRTAEEQTTQLNRARKALANLHLFD